MTKPKLAPLRCQPVAKIGLKLGVQNKLSQSTYRIWTSQISESTKVFGDSAKVVWCFGTLKLIFLQKPDWFKAPPCLLGYIYEDARMITLLHRIYRLAN